MKLIPVREWISGNANHGYTREWQAIKLGNKRHWYPIYKMHVELDIKKQLGLVRAAAPVRSTKDHWPPGWDPIAEEARNGR